MELRFCLCDNNFDDSLKYIYVRATRFLVEKVQAIKYIDWYLDWFYSLNYEYRYLESTETKRV